MTTRVIISEGLCTSETLQQGVCREHHVLDLLDTAISTSRDGGNVLHDTLCGFRLPRTGFTRDDDTLVLVVRVHVVIGGFCDAEHVRGDLETVLALVLLQYIVGVNAQICPTPRTVLSTDRVRGHRDTHL